MTAVRTVLTLAKFIDKFTLYEIFIFIHCTANSKYIYKLCDSNIINSIYSNNL